MNKILRMVDTSHYHYVNVNPKNKYGGDCVIRAIALALNQSWEQTVRELTELGLKKGFILNDVHLYPKYLESKGFIQMKEPRDYWNKKMSISEFLDLHKGEKLKVIVANAGSHHVTCIKDNKVNDIWNCSSQTMHKYWIKLGV